MLQKKICGEAPAYTYTNNSVQVHACIVYKKLNVDTQTATMAFTTNSVYIDTSTVIYSK